MDQGGSSEATTKVLEVSPTGFTERVQGTRERRTKDHDETLV